MVICKNQVAFTIKHVHIEFSIEYQNFERSLFIGTEHWVLGLYALAPYGS